MANTITAGNSTNGGTQIVTDTSGTLNIVTGSGSGTTALTVDGSQNVAVNGNMSFNSGYGSAAVAYGCRAWVNFNGQGTVAIRASGNVSSITDNGVGAYSINFTNDMPDANYSVQISASLSYSLLNIFSPSIASSSSGAELAPTTTSCSTYIATSNTSPFDPKYVQAVIFR